MKFKFGRVKVAVRKFIIDHMPGRLSHRKYMKLTFYKDGSM
jgi:hypothetical protein